MESKKSNHDNLASLEEVAQYMNAATSDPDHSLHSLASRYKEITKNKAKVESSLNSLMETRSKLQLSVKEQTDAFAALSPPNLGAVKKRLTENLLLLMQNRMQNLDLPNLNSKSQKSLLDKRKANDKELRKTLQQVKSILDSLWPGLEVLGHNYQLLTPDMRRQHFAVLQLEALDRAVSEKAVTEDFESNFNAAKEDLMKKLSLSAEVSKSLSERYTEVLECCKNTVDSTRIHDEAADAFATTLTNVTTSMPAFVVTFSAHRLDIISYLSIRQDWNFAFHLLQRLNN